MGEHGIDRVLLGEPLHGAGQPSDEQQPRDRIPGPARRDQGTDGRERDGQQDGETAEAEVPGGRRCRQRQEQQRHGGHRDGQ